MTENNLLLDIWNAQASTARETEPMCLVQEGLPDGRVEYRINRRAVYIDYAPSDKHYQPGKLYAVEGHKEVLPLQDISRVHPETFLSDESLKLTDDMLDSYFLPCHKVDGVEVGLAAMSEETEGQLLMKHLMPYSPAGSFHFVGLAIYTLPKPVREAIRESGATLTELDARICKVRSSTVVALLLSLQSKTLIVTFERVNYKNQLVDNLYFTDDGPRYKLDGYRMDTGTFFQVVQAIEVTMKGLSNPVKKKPVEPVQAVQKEAPVVEPQVENIQPEQAEEIAKEAPTADEQIKRVCTMIDNYEKGDPETVAEVDREKTRLEAMKAEIEVKKDTQPAVDPAEEPQKRTRTRKAPVAAGPATMKQLDNVIEYLGSPVGDMPNEDINEEIKKIRDLIIVAARRSANLHAASTNSEKALRDALKQLVC